MTFTEGQRAHYFEEVAAGFGRHTHPYPAEIADRILNFTGKADRRLRMLEIGSGSGEATSLFAPRDLSILCLEPGQALLESARQKFSDRPDIRYVQDTFDAWDPAGKRFDVIIAARALHWVRGDLRFTKTAELLVPGGVLAIFHMQRRVGESPCAKAIEALLMETAGPASPGDAASLRAQFAASRHYTGLKDLTLEWRVEADAAAYVAAIRSSPRLQPLPVPVREALLESIATTINDHGGRTEVDFLIYITMARRRRGPRWWREATARLR